MYEEERFQMLRWPVVEAGRVGNSEFVLARHEDDWVVRVGQRILMSNLAHESEIVLADVALAAAHDATRILIGGLGLGYTLRAALDRMPASSRVTVVELVPELVDWNRRLLHHLNDRPLEDPRCEVVVGDVYDFIAKSQRMFDVIMLDVDNGPQLLSQARNQRLYGDAGSRMLYSALAPEGVLGVWSAGPNAKYEQRLRRFGFDTQVLNTPARKNGRACHVIFLGKKLPPIGLKEEAS